MKPRYIVTIGDSLSDRGTFFNRYLLGLIPMKNLGGLQDKSPYGRYTNGFVWSDYLSSMIANEFIIRELKEKRHMHSTDIADALITQSLPKEYSPQNAYTLSDDKAVWYHGHPILRSYNEAGLTAHDYHWIPSTNVKLSLRRNLVSTLSHMRKKLFADDLKNGVTAEQKEQTLILDWSGANDLLIANEKPSHEIVDKAIQARIENIEDLIKHGYRQFVMFNLPDLFLTPRYKKRSEAELQNAHECSVYFNLKLTETCKKLAELHKDYSIEEFNVNELFVEGVEHPEKYGLHPEKSNTPYVKSEHFKTKEPKGYTFWDDLHFTAHIHALMGERFFNRIAPNFDFTPPKNTKERAHENGLNQSTVIAGVLGTAAAVVGLHQLGVSSKASAAVGIGLITLGMFAPRPNISIFSKTKTATETQHNMAA